MMMSVLLRYCLWNFYYGTEDYEDFLQFLMLVPSKSFDLFITLLLK